MERTDARSAEWNTATARYAVGSRHAAGTQFADPSARRPAARILEPSLQCRGRHQRLLQQARVTAYASAGNAANHQVNLERRLRVRLNQATRPIDMATYEINLPDLVSALVEHAAAGVRVRLIADAKDPDPDDADRTARYALMRVYLERLARGRDGVRGTDDDMALFADSPIFAVEDLPLRTAHGLPPSATDLPSVTVQVGLRTVSARLLADAEQKRAGA
jgi:hypothetical protein